MKKIKTFEAACKALNLKPTCLPMVTHLHVKDSAAITAFYKLSIIAEALNEGWQPNWNNSNEWKYYPWMLVKASAKQQAGSGLSFYDYDFAHTHTAVGSRLCFKSRELAEYAGRTFKKLYEDYMLIPQ